MPSLTKVQTGFLAPQGAFELDPGTASAPGLKFSTSAATGMFSPSTGALAFSTGSTQNALTILSGGNVGIGTTNPDNKFEVHDRTTSLTSTPVVTSRIMRADGTYNPRIDIRHSTTGTDINHTYSTSAECMTISIGNVERIRINGNGNVGIGTTNPIRKLSIYDSTPSAATTTDFILWSDGTRTSTLNQTGSSYSYAGVGSNEMWYYSNSSYSAITLGSDGAIPIKFVSGGGERVRITSGGNIGIGTTNPSQKLHVENGSTYLNKYGDNVSNSYGLYVNTTGYAPNDSSGPHYGLRVRQLGARYALNYGIYSEVEDDIGFFGTSTVDGMSLRGCGVYGYSPVSNQAYQESIGVYGKTESLGGWNYNRIYGIKGYARPGVSSFDGTTYYLQAGYGGHFLAHGKGNSIGVYADAYLDASPGAGQKAVPFIAASNGTELMRVESNGNIGIGTTNPITKLDVRNGVITAGSNQSTNGSELLRGYYSEGALTVIGSEHSSGGAVIGYAVKPSTSALGAFLSSTSITIGRGAYSIDGNAHRWYAGSAQTVAENSSVTMNELMRLTTSGNVGIGTVSPGAKLHTVGKIRFGSNITYYGEIDHDASVTGANIYNSVDTGGHIFQRNGNELIRINAAGNLGIGVADPAYKLHISGNASFSGNQSSPAYLYANGGGDDSSLLIKAGSTAGVWSQIEVTGNWNGSTNIGGKVALYTGGTERQSINAIGAIIKNQATREYNYSGYVLNNASITIDVPVVDDTAVGAGHKIWANHTHINWGAYGALLECWVSSRGASNQEQINTHNITSGQGGAWTVTKPNATTLRISKSAGSYSGVGYYWVRVITNHF